jgi:hypothetical protein
MLSKNEFSGTEGARTLTFLYGTIIPGKFDSLSTNANSLCEFVLFQDSYIGLTCQMSDMDFVDMMSKG